MRPPACVSCKWGTGTTCEKPTSTASSKEVEAKLKEMMNARLQQDAMWVLPAVDSKSTNGYTTQSTSSLTILQNKRK